MMFKFIKHVCYPFVHSGLSKNSYILHNVKKTYLPLVTIKYCHTQTDVSEVYKGPLSRQIRSVKLFSLMTSITGVLVQPMIYQKAIEQEASTGAVLGICTFVGFFTFITPLLLHYVTKKYVTSIMYNSREDSYMATIYTILLRKREVHFKPGEPIVPDVLGAFTSMTVRGIPLFIDARFFTDINHYKKIMGYDKPMDFKLNVKN